MAHTNVEPPASAPIRVGLIGAGGIGSFHGESLAWRIPGATLAAIADPAREIAERVASSLDYPYATPEPAQVLKDPSIQAVVIAAPPPVHADLIEAAAGAGKAVFCEKPMAVTLADADRAIEAASAAGVPLQVGFNRRFAPLAVRLQEQMSGRGPLMVTYRVNAGTVFYLGFDTRYRHADRINPNVFQTDAYTRTNRAIFTKLQYLFRYQS